VPRAASGASCTSNSGSVVVVGTSVVVVAGGSVVVVGGGAGGAVVGGAVVVVVVGGGAVVVGDSIGAAGSVWVVPAVPLCSVVVSANTGAVLVARTPARSRPEARTRARDLTSSIPP